MPPAYKPPGSRAAVIRLAIAITALVGSPFVELIAGARPFRLRRILLQSAGSTDLLTIARRDAVLTGGTSAALTLSKADTTQPDHLVTGKSYSVASTGGGGTPVLLATYNCFASSMPPIDMVDSAIVINPTETLTLMMAAATAMRGFVELEEF